MHGFYQTDLSIPVGRKKPNAWGLYDMHGNLWRCTYSLLSPKSREPRNTPNTRNNSPSFSVCSVCSVVKKTG